MDRFCWSRGGFVKKRFGCLAFMIVLTSEYVLDLSILAYVVPSFCKSICGLIAMDASVRRDPLKDYCMLHTEA